MTSSRACDLLTVASKAARLISDVNAPVQLEELRRAPMSADSSAHWIVSGPPLFNYPCLYYWLFSFFWPTPVCNYMIVYEWILGLIVVRSGQWYSSPPNVVLEPAERQHPMPSEWPSQHEQAGRYLLVAPKLQSLPWCQNVHGLLIHNIILSLDFLSLY